MATATPAFGQSFAQCFLDLFHQKITLDEAIPLFEQWSQKLRPRLETHLTDSQILAVRLAEGLDPLVRSQDVESIYFTKLRFLRDRVDLEVRRMRRDQLAAAEAELLAAQADAADQIAKLNPDADDIAQLRLEQIQGLLATANTITGNRAKLTSGQVSAAIQLHGVQMLIKNYDLSIIPLMNSIRGLDGYTPEKLLLSENFEFDARSYIDFLRMSKDPRYDRLEALMHQSREQFANELQKVSEELKTEKAAADRQFLDPLLQKARELLGGLPFKADISNRSAEKIAFLTQKFQWPETPKEEAPHCCFSPLGCSGCPYLLNFNIFRRAVWKAARPITSLVPNSTVLQTLPLYQARKELGPYLPRAALGHPSFYSFKRRYLGKAPHPSRKNFVPLGQLKSNE